MFLKCKFSYLFISPLGFFDRDNIERIKKEIRIIKISVDNWLNWFKKLNLLSILEESFKEPEEFHQGYQSA